MEDGNLRSGVRRACVPLTPEANLTTMNLTRLRTLWNLSREGANHYQTGSLRTFFRFYQLSKQFHFPPEEACRLGLVDPHLDDDQIRSRYISKNYLMKIQARFNPRDRLALTEDKEIFYPFCKAHGIPHPEVLATIGPMGGWTRTGRNVVDRREWERVLMEELPHRFILKPSGGCHGEGVRRIERKGDGFIDHEGSEWTASRLIEFLTSGPAKSRWILQEVLANHPELVRLTGTEAVSTSRIITQIHPNGDCRVLHATLRVIIGRNIIDNISDGKTGNLVCDLDFETGVLTQCKNPVARWGPRTVEAHPGTGVRFKGFQLPDWTQACRLAESIAPKFLPSKMLGWDVAFSTEGPTIIETNACWDPPNDHDTAPIIVEALREEYDSLLAKRK